MRFGLCTAPKNVAAIMAMGYDFAEIGFASNLRPEEPEANVMPALRDMLAGWPSSVEAFNGFLPGDLKVVGPKIDSVRQERYLRSGFHRAAALGGQIVVFGSGGSRNLPNSFSKTEAEMQVVEFLKMAAPLASAEGLTIAIEPLNSNECNFINSVADGMAIVRAVDNPAVQVLSDLYHVDADKQLRSETSDAGASLAHVHVAGQVDRRAPIIEDANYLAGFFGILKRMRYSGRISAEAPVSDIDKQAPEILETMRQAWRVA